MNGFLGIDVGSVSTNMVVLDDEQNVIEKVYFRTQGEPIRMVQKGLENIRQNISGPLKICASGTTGSGRNLAGLIVGADAVKNEITAHAVGASSIVPDVRTVLEIGGQDSKIIILQNGVVTDFGMNTVCAAGTGSFLEQQASRLEIPIEEFGRLALEAENPVRIAGRCSVFAESDMIHKQQMGYEVRDIIYGLCEAMVRNYLNNVAKGKELLPPVVFQGGVAANAGIKKAFKEELKTEIIVPKHHEVMGAVGAAILAREAVENRQESTSFKGFSVSDIDFTPSSFECDGCPNRCEVIEIMVDDEIISRWGYRCNRWEEPSVVENK